MATHAPPPRPSTPGLHAPFTIVEASIGDMQRALASGRVTSWQLVTESLTRIVRYNWQLNAVLAVNPQHGQSLLDISDEMDVDAERVRYEADRKKDLQLAATEGIDAVMDARKLDAIVFPGGSGAGIAARPG